MKYNISFKKWLEMAGTGSIYDAKVKPRTFNWLGAIGSTGTSIEGDPIKPKSKKKKK